MTRHLLVDRESIIAAGLSIADHEGLEAVTMKSVASRLGVTPMALYRHVENKDQLLDGILDLALLDIALPPDPMEEWRDRLHWLIRGIREAAQLRPEVFALLVQRPRTTPTERSVQDALFVALYDGGIPANRVYRVERVISTVVIGAVVGPPGSWYRSLAEPRLDLEFALVVQMIDWFVDEQRRSS